MRMRKTLLTPPLWLLLSLLLLGWCMWAEAANPHFNDPYFSDIFGDRLEELRDRLLEERSRVTDEERTRLLLKEQARLAEQRGVQVDVYREQTLDRTVFFPEGAAAYWVQWPGGRLEKREMDGRAFIEQGRIYVPVRYLSYALGVREENVLWDGTAQKVTLKEPGFPVAEMTVGKVGVLSDGRPVPGVDVPPVLRQLPAWRTYLPARWTAQALGYQVDWDDKSRIAVVWRSGPRPEVPERVKAQAERERKLADAPEAVRRAAEAVPEAEVKKQVALTTTTWWLIVGPGCKIDFPPAGSNAVAGLSIYRTATEADLGKAREALSRAVPEETLNAFWPVLLEDYRKWMADRGYQVRKMERFAGRLIGWNTWPEAGGILGVRFGEEGV
jgi:hypothetical protein